MTVFKYFRISVKDLQELILMSQACVHTVMHLCLIFKTEQ